MSRYIDAEWLKEHIEVISYEGMWHTMETDERAERMYRAWKEKDDE